MLRETSGDPCELSREVIGMVAVDDRDPSLDGETCRLQFTETFTNYLLLQAPLGGGITRVRQSGRLTIDQFGPIDFETRPQQSGGDPSAGFHVAGLADCPTGGDGELVLQEPQAVLRFQESGGGDPEIVVDGSETVPGCVGISVLSTCE
jgi:hypothetical protein